MNTKPLLLLWLLALALPAWAHPPPVFVVAADNPYMNTGDEQLLEELYRSAGKVTFLAHLGDIKSGARRCTDAYYQRIAGLFTRLQAPLVYSPGDNDWLDCRSLIAGGHDPDERLQKLREIFFADPAVLRLDQLPARRPADIAAQFPELFWFRYGHVLFINWHGVGSDNNHNPEDPAAMAEFIARKTAVERITAAALAGYKGYLRAVVVLVHANIRLDKEDPPLAYRHLQEQLNKVLRETRKVPVLLIHGDDHAYLIDQPWKQRPQGDRLWRLNLPGSPQMAAVKVEFTRNKPQPFRFTLLENVSEQEEQDRPPE